MPIAISTQDANEQHYEVPTAFYEEVLVSQRNNTQGKHLKYSCSLFEDPTWSLEEAELAMLNLYVERVEAALSVNL